MALLPVLRREWTISSLCDGFSLAGVLLLSYSGLRFLRSQNAFSGISYIGARIKSLLFPFSNKEISNYSNYRKQPKTQKEEFDGSALITGAGYLSFAVVLLFFV